MKDYLAVLLKSASFWIIVTNMVTSYDILRQWCVIMMIYGTRVTLNPNFLPEVPWSVKIAGHLLFHWTLPLAAKHYPKKPPNYETTLWMILMLYAYDTVNPGFYKLPFMREELLLLIMAYHFFGLHLLKIIDIY